MGDTGGEERRSWWQWRPLLAYGFIFAVILGLGYSFMADRYVTQYIKTIPRDTETGIMKGFEPFIRGDESNTKAVLMLHGFIGAPDCFNDLPDAIAAEGWYVKCMLLPGHGTTPRDFEKTSPQDMLHAVQEELATMQAQYETVVIVGHSMGGALATLAVADLGADGLVLIAPLFGLSVP